MQKDHKQQSRNALTALKHLADKNKITNYALAEKIGIRPQTVGQMFSGKFHPTLDNVFRALNAIGDLSGKTFTLADIDEPKTLTFDSDEAAKAAGLSVGDAYWAESKPETL